MLKDETLGSDRTFREWMSTLDTMALHQIPYAASRALNDSMFPARKEVLAEYDSDIGSAGINYFRKDLKIERSHKDQTVIAATIGEKTGYMAMQQFGHTKTADSGRDMAIPTERARRRYGTKSGKMKRSGWPSRLTRNYRGPVAAGKRGGAGNLSSRERATFPILTRDGRRMIVSREDHANRIGGASYYAHEHFVVLYVYVAKAEVPKTFDMAKPVVGTVRKLFPKKFQRFFQKALETAK